MLQENLCQVSVMYQRDRELNREFLERLEKVVGPIMTHASFDDFRSTILDHDVFIGYRNHGAIPAAGAGKASLLLGTDYRQALAELIPFMSKIDISYTGLECSAISDWFSSLNPAGVGHSCLNFRNATFERWQTVLKPFFGRI